MTMIQLLLIKFNHCRHDNSIIKLTNQMKRKFITAKADFDKYVKQNLINSKKTMEKDSIIAKESQIRDLLMYSQENNILDPEIVISGDTMHHKAVNETPRAKISDQTLTDESMSQMNDQKDSFDDDSLSEILSVKSFPKQHRRDYRQIL